MAFRINKKAFDIDEQLKESSELTLRELKKMSGNDAEKMQKNFLMSMA